ncbi:MAG: YceD family protein [Bryobacteraceae bacterium]
MEVRKVRFDETFPPGQIDFSGEELEQGSPLRATGVAELLPHTDGEVRIAGRYTVEMTAECDRCLGRARFPLEAAFDLFYRPAAFLAGEEEVAIDEGEAEMGFYEGEGLELEDILREQVLLALPMQRVCSESCKGICPVCGKNRNEIACDCRLESGDGRWEAFRKLRIVKE